jgi:uncharacterized Tic20 family protein
MEHEEKSSAKAEATAPASTAGKTASDTKTLAMLAWIFAPITSFVWKDHEDAFVKSHARESLYFGVASILVALVGFVVQTCFSIVIGYTLTGPLFGIASLISCVWSLLWLAVGLAFIVPRIVGVVKANSMEEWTVPYVNEFMKRFIKL